MIDIDNFVYWDAFRWNKETRYYYSGYQINEVQDLSGLGFRDIGKGNYWQQEYA